MTTTRECVDKQTVRLALTPASVWNAVAPVSRLPLELLAHIFLLCACTDYHERSGDAGVPQWVNVSYVCSRWRFVAIGFPVLWSYLFVASSRWTDALLIRSREVPLWVRVHFTRINRQTALKFMEQVAPHSERFRDCCIELNSDDDEVVLPMLSSRPAPLLHTLAITHKRPKTLWNLMDTDAQVDDSFTLFNGDTPALRQLHLNDYFITLCSPTLGGLTVLRLCDLHSSARPTVAELKVMLNRMPDLAQLYLDNAIRGGLYDPARLEAEKAHLPRLARLFIAEPFSTVVQVLSCIDTPVTTAVRLRCRTEIHMDRKDYTPFYTLLSQRFRNFENGTTSFAPIRTMVLDRAPYETSIIFSNSERNCGGQKCTLSIRKDCDCDVPLKIEIGCSSDNALGDEWIVGICRSVPLANLKNVILNSWRLPSALWFDVLWHLQELRYIELIDVDLSEITTMLSLSRPPFLENADRPTYQCTNQPFAPSLEELCLDGVSVVRELRRGGNPSSDRTHATLFREALASRRAAGYVLDQLIINGNFLFTQKEVKSIAREVSHAWIHKSAYLLPDDEDFEDCEEETSEEFDSDWPLDNDNLESVTYVMDKKCFWLRG